MSIAASTGHVNSEFAPVVEKVSSIVHKITGNRLGEKQAYMIETRIRKRMLDIGLKEAKDYSRYVDEHYEKECAILVGLITTHHTFFFREFAHFEILKKMLPDLVAQANKRGDKILKIWSAACSRGQEVYSLAMFLDYHLPQYDHSMSFKIFGTDIDVDSISVASNGVYHQNEIKEIPMNYLGNNWAKGSGDISLYAKVKNNLKSKCEFKPGNLLKISESVKNEKFDVIFCRNVFIYFETEQVQKITKELMSHLYPSGILFSGISEPLTGMHLEIVPIGPSAYMPKSTSVAPVHAPIISPVSDLQSQGLIRVLCVDDSQSILTLLKRVLNKENGFEVVATALNGKDAMEKLRNHKVDVVTLDIHMPEMDGVTYLQKNFNKLHPPVVIISSASRADSEVAMKALKYGASDYVEKPALNILEERGEEIRTKLRSVAQDIQRKAIVSSFDNENQKHYSISSPEKKLRVVFASLSDLPKLKELSKNLDLNQPPTIIFFEGQAEILEAVILENASGFKHQIQYVDKEVMRFETNKFYFADFKNYFPVIYKRYSGAPCSLLSFGSISSHAAKLIGDWKGIQLLVEDINESANKKHPLMPFSTDVVPATSFSYMSCRYLSTK